MIAATGKLSFPYFEYLVSTWTEYDCLGARVVRYVIMPPRILELDTEIEG